MIPRNAWGIGGYVENLDYSVIIMELNLNLLTYLSFGQKVLAMLWQQRTLSTSVNVIARWNKNSSKIHLAFGAESTLRCAESADEFRDVAVRQLMMKWRQRGEFHVSVARVLNDGKKVGQFPRPTTHRNKCRGSIHTEIRSWNKGKQRNLQFLAGTPTVICWAESQHITCL